MLMQGQFPLCIDPMLDLCSAIKSKVSNHQKSNQFQCEVKFTIVKSNANVHN